MTRRQQPGRVDKEASFTIPSLLMSSTVFISHSHENADIAGRIAGALEGIGLRPWIQQQDIGPGDSFIERMGQGLSEASYVLVLLSKASTSSRWVNREWMSALAAGGSVLIPILLEDCEVPTLLRDIIYIDLRENIEGGLNQIVEFFKREIRRLSPLGRTRGYSLKEASRRQLRLIAMRCLDDFGLRSFCFDAGVEPGSLAGGSVHERLVSLLHLAATDGLVLRFAEWLETERERCVKHQVRELEGLPLWTWNVGA